MQPSNIGTFLQSRMDLNTCILVCDRDSERLLVVINWDYMLAYIYYTFTSMQRIGGEYQL